MRVMSNISVGNVFGKMSKDVVCCISYDVIARRVELMKGGVEWLI